MAVRRKKGGKKIETGSTSRQRRKRLRGKRRDERRTVRTADIREIQQRLRKRPKRRKANLGRLLIAAFLMLLQLGILIWGLYKMKAFVLSSYIVFQIVGAVARDPDRAQP